MIISNSVVSAETNSSMAVACKIEANSVMFELLSARLYQDKPMAVIRELSTNALDAHIEAGTAGEPFEVHLPTRLEPFFSIRDFGTGMSEETVMELYSTMGSSSKRHSNAFNGALGVGSKSPFAYTQGGAFTLSSFHNGVNTIYSIYSDSGVPSIAKLGSFPTDMRNGIEVSVPVHTSDINDFTNRATKVYTWFKVRPKVNVELHYPEVSTPVFSGTNWKLFANSEKACVLMANVAYPIDAQTHNLGVLGTAGLVLFAQTGQVQMAGSREGLSYTKETLEALKKWEKKITDELMLQINSMVKSNKNYLEVARTLSKLPIIVLRAIQAAGILPKYIKVNYNSTAIYGEGLFEFRTTRIYSNQYNRSSLVTPDTFDNQVFMFNDSPNLASAVLREYKESNLGKIMCIDWLGSKSTAQDKVRMLHTLKEFVTKLGITVENASDLALKLNIVAPKSSSSKSVTRVQSGVFYGFEYNPTNTSSIGNVRVTISDKKKIIYIPTLTNSTTTKDWGVLNGNYSPSSLLSNIKVLLQSVRYKGEVIVITIPKTSKSFATNCEYYIDFLKREMSKYSVVDNITLAKEIANKFNFNLIGSLNLNIPKDFKSALTELSVALESNNNFINYERYCKGMCTSLGFPVKVIVKDISEKTQKTMVKYDSCFCCSIYGEKYVSRFEQLTHLIDKCSK